MTSELYKIGLVSRMTKVSAERLRQWERRYDFAPEAREGQTRFYSDEQVQRIKKINVLADQGHGLAQLMQMDNAELDKRFDRISPQTRITETQGFRALFIGRQLASLATAETIIEEFPNVQSVDSVGDIPIHEFQTSDFDAVAIYQTSLDCEKINELISAARKPPLVVYKHFTEDALNEAQDMSWTLIQASDLSAKTLASGMTELAYTSIASDTRFSDDDLKNISEVAFHDGLLSAQDIIDSLESVRDLEEHVLRNAKAKTHKRIGQALHQARVSLENALELSVVKDELLLKSAYLSEKHQSKN